MGHDQNFKKLISPNLVARLNLPNMAYAPEDKLEVYAQAVRGLLTLEPDPERRIQYLEVPTIPLDETLADRATEGYRRLGKGRHPAGPNLGDCFSYALAIREQVPLPFKGDDFSKTDIRVVGFRSVYG